MNKEVHPKIENQFMLEREFNVILCRIIEESLKKVGENVNSVIYYVLKHGYGIEEEEIPEHIEEFSECIEIIFGKEGRTYIEKIITSNLYLKIKGEHGFAKGKNFAQKVNNARHTYIKRKQI